MKKLRQYGYTGIIVGGIIFAVIFLGSMFLASQTGFINFDLNAFLIGAAIMFLAPFVGILLFRPLPFEAARLVVEAAESQLPALRAELNKYLTQLRNLNPADPYYEKKLAELQAKINAVRLKIATLQKEVEKSLTQ